MRRREEIIDCDLEGCDAVVISSDAAASNWKRYEVLYIPKRKPETPSTRKLVSIFEYCGAHDDSEILSSIATVAPI